MPYLTEYNTRLVLKKIIGDIPDDIEKWRPYYRYICYLNRLDLTFLKYIRAFCENPINTVSEIYNPVKSIDKKEFVFEGSQPSYHKYESCDRLISNYINFRIPHKIREGGDEKIEEFRLWFKENQTIFTEDPAVYQMRLHLKYGILQPIEKVEFNNSGYRYKENLTNQQLQERINSLIENESEYLDNSDEDKKFAIRYFRKQTFLRTNNEIIENNPTSLTDAELKVFLNEYYFLFVEPTIYYLKEYFKVTYNSKIEFSEPILDYLKFKKCPVCHSSTFTTIKNDSESRIAKLKKMFGDYEFPIEPTKFYYKYDQESTLHFAFIYCRVFKCIDENTHSDTLGSFKWHAIEFINENHRHIYKNTKIYVEELTKIRLFNWYITKIEMDIITEDCNFTTYGIEL